MDEIPHKVSEQLPRHNPRETFGFWSRSVYLDFEVACTTRHSEWVVIRPTSTNADFLGTSRRRFALQLPYWEKSKVIASQCNGRIISLKRRFWRAARPGNAKGAPVLPTGSVPYVAHSNLCFAEKACLEVHQSNVRQSRSSPRFGIFGILPAAPRKSISEWPLSCRPGCSAKAPQLLPIVG